MSEFDDPWDDRIYDRMAGEDLKNPDYIWESGGADHAQDLKDISDAYKLFRDAVWSPVDSSIFKTLYDMAIDTRRFHHEYDLPAWPDIARVTMIRNLLHAHRYRSLFLDARLRNMVDRENVSITELRAVTDNAGLMLERLESHVASTLPEVPE